MNALISKDLTTLTATLPPIALPAREPCMATTPYHQSDSRDDLADGLWVASFATDVPFIAPAPQPKAPETKRDLLARAHRALREPLTALLRLNSDWDFQRTSAVAQRMIDQQRQTLEVMTDLIDGFLTIAESETTGQLTEHALRSAGGGPRHLNATHASPAETWSAAWSMNLALDPPDSPVVDWPASQAHRVLLIDEDQGALGALRIYLLCAGYRVCAVASADEALDLALMACVAPSLIDIVIADLDLTRDGDGIAAIDKTRRLAGYNIPAVLLMNQASIEIGKPGLGADVSPLRKPVNLEELNVLIGELLKRPKARPPGETENRWAAVGFASRV